MKRVLITGTILTVVAVSTGAYSFFKGKPSELSAGGTLEARNVNVGSKAGGRVRAVFVSEGDSVDAGQILVTLEDTEFWARLVQARGRVEEARENLAKLRRGSRPEEIEEARAAAGDAQEPGYRMYEVERAMADLQKARADSRDAERTLERDRRLAEDGVISQQQLDDTRARKEMAQAQVASMQGTLSATQARVNEALATQRKLERGSRPEDIGAARAALTAAEGLLQEQEAMWEERQVKAPAAAHVEVLDVRPGDLVLPYTTVAKLLEADQLYVVVYVPETEIGKVQVGQVAAVAVDGFPNQNFRGYVEQIRQKAEFLPRNVETFEEREHEVIGVKLRVHNQDNKLRVGIHANVRFLH